MAAKYLIRLDDASEYINEEKWNSILSLLDKYKIKPIIAVIPNNKDVKLINSHPNKNFWNTVREWNKKGYSIAMHGYDHKYITKNGGLLNLNKYSEFAGVQKKEQQTKIRKSIAIFRYNKIKPKIFVAPAHSFDQITIDVLLEETDINIISDGLFIRPIIKQKIKWLPVQLSRPKMKIRGTWTICLHPEKMDVKHLKDLEKFIKKRSHRFVEVNEIEFRKDETLVDTIESLYITYSNIIKRKIAKMII